MEELFSTCPLVLHSVRPSVHSFVESVTKVTYEHDILKTNEPISMQIGIIGHYEARALNCQRLGSEGEKSRSHETEYILRGLALRSSSFSICEFMLYSCIDEYTRWSPPQNIVQKRSIVYLPADLR